MAKKCPPSVLHFEQGREWGGWQRNVPPPSCVSSKGESGMVGNETSPLRLAFRAREGVGGWLAKKCPPSCVLSKGESVVVGNSSEGGVGGGVSTKETPPLAFRVRGVERVC